MDQPRSEFAASLNLHVVWHPSCDVGADVAEALFRTICADVSRPMTRGLGIPVRFWTTRTPQDVPTAPPVGAAGRDVVVILVDDHMVAADWSTYIQSIRDSVVEGVDLVIPVALSDSAFSFTPVSGLNCVRAFAFSENARLLVLQNRIIHRVLGLLTDSPKQRVFLSHAKADGTEIAVEVRRYLHENAGLDDFFDATDIAVGDDFAEVLQKAVAESSAVLSIHTDEYGSREWCRLEVLMAKRHRIPTIVLAAVEHGELRSFPYMGNVPVVRWAPNDLAMERIVRSLLLEALRNSFFPDRVAAACSSSPLAPNDHVAAYPPELLTLIPLMSPRSDESIVRFIYPDPPLGVEEQILLREFDDRIVPTTLTELLAR